MAIQFTVSLQKIMDDLSLETIFMPEEPSKIMISSADVNRPGLQLGGFFDFFDPKRVQIVGKSENAYLAQLSPEAREKSLENYFAARPVAIIISRGNTPDPLMREKAEKYSVPLFRNFLIYLKSQIIYY